MRKKENRFFSARPTLRVQLFLAPATENKQNVGFQRYD